jgi:hypothetical protein
MKTKYTPGPWAYQDTAGSHQFAVYAEATGNDIALVFNRSNESESDARLIAAAPDMYETLQEIAASGKSCDGGASVESLVHMALAALARVNKT